MKRCIFIKSNQLSVCSQMVSVNSPTLSFMPLFSVIKDEKNGIRLELTPVAAGYYKISDDFQGTDLDKAKYLVSLVTSSYQDTVTDMHQTLDLFASATGLPNSLMMFENDGSLSNSKKKDAPAASTKNVIS